MRVNVAFLSRATDADDENYKLSCRDRYHRVADLLAGLHTVANYTVTQLGSASASFEWLSPPTIDESTSLSMFVRRNGSIVRNVARLHKRHLIRVSGNENASMLGEILQQLLRKTRNKAA